MTATVAIIAQVLFVTLLSITTQPTEGVKCLSCSDVSQPRLCHLIDHCGDGSPGGESCSVQMYRLDNGDIRYKTGCLTRQECDNLSGERNMTKKDIPHNSHVLCTECCQGDLCNVNGCGAPAYPSMYGPVCYDCEDELHPDSCKKIRLCSQNEKCLMETRTEFMQSTYVTKCLRSHICDALFDGFSIVGRRHARDDVTQKSTCNYCCDGNLCNSGCFHGNNSLTVRIPSSTRAPHLFSSRVSSTVRIPSSTRAPHIFSSRVSSTVRIPSSTRAPHIFSSRVSSTVRIPSTSRVSSTVRIPSSTRAPSLPLLHVAFSAMVTSEQNIVNNRVKFDEVFINDGGSYDNITGIFTCVKAGPYFFTWTIQATGTQVVTQLMKNGGVQKVLRTVPQRGGNSTNEGIYVVRLTPGDRVWIQHVDGNILPRVSSFSGWMIENSAMLVHAEYAKNASQYLVLENHGNGFTVKNKSFRAPSTGTYLLFLSMEQGVYCDTALDSAFYFSGGDGTTGAFIKMMNAGYIVNFGQCSFSIVILQLNSTEYFSAISGGNNGIVSSLPFSRAVFINHNNVFDSTSGIYTCDISGTYVLAWSIETNSASFKLMLNGKVMMEGYGSDINYGSSNNVVILHLQRGDRIWISTSGDVISGYTMFSGFRLY